MNTIKTATASVIGARHARVARNGQDSVAVWSDSRAAVVVVCDGCSSGVASEVGARMGASLFAKAISARIAAGDSPCDPAVWADARADVVAQLGALADQMPGELAQIVREHFLFTLLAAAVRGDEAAVWALGDGVYSFGDYTRQLGPFADNAPPYLGYDLLGDARPAHFEVVCLSRGMRGANVEAIIVGTDGAAEIIGGVERFASRRYVEHADALRRELSMLAKPQERIDWEARRVVRTPAMLQDDCAIGVLRFERPSVATSLVVVEASS
jgi:hypothetical protein